MRQNPTTRARTPTTRVAAAAWSIGDRRREDDIRGAAELRGYLIQWIWSAAFWIDFPVALIAPFSSLHCGIGAAAVVAGQAGGQTLGLEVRVVDPRQRDPLGEAELAALPVVRAQADP